MPEALDRQRETEPGEAPARFDVYVLRPLVELVFLALLGGRSARPEVHLEMAVQLFVSEFAERPLLLDELRPLSKCRVLLDEPVAAETERDLDVQPVVFDPLGEVTVGEFFSSRISEHGKPTRSSLERRELEGRRG